MGSPITSILKTCSTCKITFPSLREMLDHEKTHQKLSTSINSASIISKDSLPKANDDVAYDSWTCDQCSAEFIGRHAILRHQRDWHGRGPLSTGGGFMGVKVIGPRKRHVGPMTKNRCHYCSAAFTTKAALANHLRSHPNSLPRTEKGKRLSDGDGEGTSTCVQSLPSKNNDHILSADSDSSGHGSETGLVEADYSLASFKKMKHRSRHRRNALRKLLARHRIPYSSTALTVIGRSDRDHSVSKFFASKLNTTNSVAEVLRKACGSKIKPMMDDKTDNPTDVPQLPVIDSVASISKSQAKGSPLLCKYCYGLFCRLDYLIAHQKRSHLNGDAVHYFCFKCKWRADMSSDKELVDHLLEEHSELKHEIKRRMQMAVECDDYPKRGRQRNKVRVKKVTGRPRGRPSKRSMEERSATLPLPNLHGQTTEDHGSVSNPFGSSASDSGDEEPTQDCFPAIGKVKMEEPEDGFYGVGNSHGDMGFSVIKNEPLDSDSD